MQTVSFTEAENNLKIVIDQVVNDDDADILEVVRDRLKNPAKRIRVNLDDL